MKETLFDLNSLLFEQLEKLSNEDLNGEELMQEIKRANAISSTAKNVIENASLILSVAKFKEDSYNEDDNSVIKLIGDGNEK